MLKVINKCKSYSAYKNKRPRFRQGRIFSEQLAVRNCCWGAQLVLSNSKCTAYCLLPIAYFWVYNSNLHLLPPSFPENNNTRNGYTCFGNNNGNENTLWPQVQAKRQQVGQRHLK